MDLVADRSSRAVTGAVLVLCALSVRGCSSANDQPNLIEVDLVGVPLDVVEPLAGRWFVDEMAPALEIDLVQRTMLIAAPRDLRIDGAHAADGELRIVVHLPSGERSERALTLVDDDLLMIAPVGELPLCSAFLAERLSGLEAAKHSMVKLAERSAREVDRRLDWLIRAL